VPEDAESQEGARDRVGDFTNVVIVDRLGHASGQPRDLLFKDEQILNVELSLLLGWGKYVVDQRG
jgi:hypothetical protein